MSLIHKTAIVSKDANLADNVSVGPYSIIGPGVAIGESSVIDSYVVIKGKTIREYTTINKGTIQDVGTTRLGDDNWIMAYVHIAHDCQVGSNTIFANNTTLGGHVIVGDYAIFGGFSGAHQFCKIGAHSFLGIYSGIARDLPPYVIVMGQPAEPRGINLEGLKRRDFNSDQIRNIKTAYKYLYMSELRLEEAVSKILTIDDIAGEITILLEFLKDATRGIVRKK